MNLNENINKELRKVGKLAFDIIPKSILVLIQLQQHFKEQIIYNKVEERIFNPKRIIELKNVYIKCNYFRDIPNDEYLCVSYALLKDFGLKKIPDKNLVNAIVLKMIYDKNISIEELGKGKYNLILNSKPKDKTLENLYDIFKYAAKNNILEIDELRIYVENHHDIYDDFFYTFRECGYDFLEKKGAYKVRASVELTDLTNIGVSELKEIYGLEKYLNDFTLIEIRGIREIVIWEHLLVYAALFGLSDKFYRENKELVPVNIDAINLIGKIVSWWRIM